MIRVLWQFHRPGDRDSLMQEMYGQRRLRGQVHCRDSCLSVLAARVRLTDFTLSLFHPGSLTKRCSMASLWPVRTRTWTKQVDGWAPLTTLLEAQQTEERIATSAEANPS